MAHPLPQDLRITPFFLGCTTAELLELARLTVLTTAVEGQVLATRGQPAHQVHLVIAGEARADPCGERVGPGSFVGDLAVLLRADESMTVVATGSMLLLSASGADATRFLVHPVVSPHLNRALSQRLARLLG